MSTAIALAVLANLFWATGNLFNVRLARNHSPMQTVLWQTCVLAVLLLPITLLKPLSLDWTAVFLTALLAIALHVGSLMFYTALSKGSAQISGAITSTVPAFIAILSIVFLGTSLSKEKLLLIAIITAGLFVVSWPSKNTKIDEGIAYAIFAVLLWAIYFTFISKTITKLGPYWANYVAVVTGALFFTFYSLASGGKKIIPTRRALLLVVASAIFVGGAPLFYNIALEQASPAIISPIAGSYAAIFIGASSIIYKDKINTRQWIGISITVMAVLVFSILNS